MKRTSLLKLMAVAAALAAMAGAAHILLGLKRMVHQMMATNLLLVLLLLVQMLRMVFAEINSWKSDKTVGSLLPHKKGRREKAAQPATEPKPAAEAAPKPASEPVRTEPSAAEPEPIRTETPVRTAEEVIAEVLAEEKPAPELLGYAEICSRSDLQFNLRPQLRCTGRRSTFTVYKEGVQYCLRPSDHWFNNMFRGSELLDEQFGALFEGVEVDRMGNYILYKHGMQPALLQLTGSGQYELISRGRLRAEAYTA